MQKIIDKMDCPHKSYLNSLNLKGDVDKTYDISRFVKELYTTKTFQELTDEKDVRPLVEELLEKAECVMDKEKEITTEVLIDHICSFSKEMISLGATVVDKNINSKIKIGLEDHFKRFDIALTFPNDSTIYLCSFHNTYKNAEGATDKKACVEWYLENEFAKNAYPGKNVKSVAILMLIRKDFTFSNYFKVMDFNNINQGRKNTIDAKECKKIVTDLTSTFTTADSEKNENPFGSCAFCPCRGLCEYFESTSKDLKVIKRQKVQGSVSLTKSQDEITDVRQGIYRVLAGAGTGKTTGIANLIVKMIQEGVSPEDLLIMTFSEKGITELKEKLDFWLQDWFIDEITSDDFNIYNFNSYGDKLLSEEYERFGYTSKPELIDQIRKMDIIKSLLDNRPEISNCDYINPLGRGGVLKKMSKFIQRATETKNDPIRRSLLTRDIVKDHPNDANEVEKLIDDYFAYLKQNNLIDYEHQNEALVKLCTVGYEDLLKKYAKPYIICDEFQDTNKNQLQFMRACTNLPTFEFLIMCGDDSQSIYSWRGADKTIMTDLAKEFPNLQDIHMTENFRSTYEIVDLANKFNDLDDSVIKKKLTSTKHGKPVELIDSSKTGGTVETVVNLIKKYIKNGYNLYDIGVIMRKKEEISQLSKALQKEKIDVIVSVSEFLRDNPKVKALCDFTKYLLDTEKTLYLAEYLQAKDSEEFDRQADIEKYVGVEGEKVKLEIEGLDEKEMVEYYMSKVEEVAKKDRIVSNLYSLLENKVFKTLEDINTFLSKLRNYEADFIVNKDEQAYDAITLMTAHASKGREFKVIVGVLDKFTNNGGEDHQCAFVTITRAMEELVLVQDTTKISNYSKNDFYYVFEGLLK